MRGVGTPTPIIGTPDLAPDLIEKIPNNEEVLQQAIRDADQMAGNPDLYRSIQSSIKVLQNKHNYSKWLVVLSDTVDMRVKNEEEASKTAKELIAQMQKVENFNLALIDTSNFGDKYAPGSPMWAVWTKIAEMLTSALGPRGHKIDATNLAKIKEAFLQVAETMNNGPVAS